MYRIIVVVLVILVIASVVVADKTVTQKTITFGEIDTLTFTQEVDDSGNGITVCRVVYHVLDTGNKVFSRQRVVAITLTGAQASTLRTFIVNNIVPAINVQEGT